ncbi:MAG: response regulator transcription factor [Alphaproteobacteria bacterium]
MKKSDTIKVKQRELTITPKQKEVLFYLAQGYQNKEIAYKMGLSVSTIKLHLAGLYLRLNVKSRIGALIIAQQLGLP